MNKKVLVIKDWDIVADTIWREFQGTGVSWDVASVLIEAVHEKLLKETLVSPGRLLASVKVDTPQVACEAKAGIIRALGEKDASELKKEPFTVLILVDPEDK